MNFSAMWRDTQTDVLEAVLDREGSNPLETQNLMVRALGLQSSLFESVPSPGGRNGTIVTAQQSGHYYAYVGNSKVDTLKMESESLSKSFTKLKYHYICDLGWHDEGDVISCIPKTAAPSAFLRTGWMKISWRRPLISWAVKP